MDKKIFFIILAVCLTIFSFSIWNLNKKETKNTPTATIFMTRNGFNPSEVSIKRGQSIEFINSESSDCPVSDVSCNFWPASDPHPTHDLYIEFDARRSITPGASFVFVFEKVGNWGFHDHFNLKNKGVIRVLP